MSKKGGMEGFLKNEDPQLEKLRKKYLSDTGIKINKPVEQTFENLEKTNQSREEIEYQIEKLKRVRDHIPLHQRLKTALKKQMKVQVGRHSIYIWRSRPFEEFAYLHVPRFFFLSFSCYVIYRINLKQQQARRWKEGVKSHRQEDISKQIDQISQVIGVNQPNQFEPLKKVEFDKSYSGDQFQYLYEKEEKDLQEQLFKMYEEIEEENEGEENE